MFFWYSVDKSERTLLKYIRNFKKAYDTVDRSMLIERIQDLGINVLLLKNIEAMYWKTEYLLKYKNISRPYQ